MRYPRSLNSRNRRFDNNLTHPAIAAGRKACAFPPAARAGFALLLRIVKEQPIKLFEKPEAKGARAACLWILVPTAPSGSRRKRWWSWTGSNRRPPACKAGALPTELQPPHALVGLDGFEPSTPALSRRCSNQLSYRPLKPVFENRRLISAGALAPWTPVQNASLPPPASSDNR